MTNAAGKWITVLLAAILWLAPSPSIAQEAPDEDEEPQEARQDGGYPLERERLVGGPTDVTTDLITSFPARDSVFPALIPGNWFDFKEDIYEKTGVKLGFSYQALYQGASDTIGIPELDDYAFGGWLLLEGKWNAYNTGDDFEGGFTAALDWRHAFGRANPPSIHGPFAVGSLWGTDVAYDEFGPTVPVLYWEQWLGKDKFVLRAGKQLSSQTYDFFRFKDSRTSFSGTPFTVHHSIPQPLFGQGVSFEWWPQKGSELYVQGTVNDMNGDPEDFGLDTFFGDRRYFYGAEIGYFWKRRFPADFDHVHLDVFYADERNEPLVPGFPNKAGGGFKLFGSKQVRRVVGFGSYTFNTAEGGGFSLTYARHTVLGGVALLKPAGIRGEVGVGLSWMGAIEDLSTPIGPARDQTGGEVYWKLLLTPNLWITPGLQFMWNPAFNPSVDFAAVPQLKFRLFF